MVLSVLLGAVAYAPATAQTLDPDGASPRSGFILRAMSGAAALSLGDAADYHQSAADTYVEAGVPVPTQRSFPAGVSAGLDVLWTSGNGS